MRALALAALALVALGCKTVEPPAPAPAASSAAAIPASASPPAASAAPPLTPEQEKAAQAVIVNDCLACHTEEMLQQQRLSPKQWAAVVKKMQGWGSQIEPSSIDPLVGYLAARYGTAAPPYVVPTIAASAAADALARLPDGPFGGGDAKKGEALYRETCAPCHANDARGSATGVCLVDRPRLYRAAEFAERVRNGRGRMPSYPTYQDAEVSALLAYLRSLRPG